MKSLVRCMRALCIVWLAMLVSLPGAVRAGTEVRLDAATQFAYAESLYAAGDFLPAAYEYKRFVFLFSGHENVENAAYKIGMCYLNARRYADAIAAFKDCMQHYPDGRHFHQSHFRISEAYLDSNQAGAAIATLRNLAVLSDDVDVRDEAWYRMGWIYIGMAQWDQAQKAFDRVSVGNSHVYRLGELSTRLAAEAEEIPRKNPNLAGSLAVIPGGGYVYCGRYQDALIAFLVNGGLIWAAYEAFSNDLYALGSVITFVEIGFYAGSIYGSMASAHKYNRRSENRWIEQLRNSLKVNLAVRPERQGAELTLSYAF